MTIDPKLTKSKLELEAFEPPHTLQWGRESWYLTASRTQSLQQLGEHRTRYTSTEPFTGIAAFFILGFLRSNLMRGYQWADEGLKATAEEKFNTY